MNVRSIQHLLDVPVGQRDEAWEFDFLLALPQATVRIVDDTPVTGPDGWPYLLLSTEKVESDDRADTLVNVIRWLSTRGLGLVINPEKSMPDFVMNYGMVWNFRERGEFLTAPPAAEIRSGALEIRDGQQLYAGAPSAGYLPQDVRSLLREFLNRQKVTEPKVLMISTDEKIWDLAFSIESLGAPPTNEHAGIAEALSWFLPTHYSVALISEKTVPGFVAL